MQPSKSTTIFSEHLSLVIFALMTLGCYLRLFLGVGLLGQMDESYWVAIASLSAKGGTPLINDVHIQQLCGLIYEPLVWLYHQFFGSTGVLLFVRHLYFILSGVTAAICFKLAKERTDFATALAVASLPLVGTAWAQPSLGYNSIGGLGFACGSLLAIASVYKNSMRLAALSGVFFFAVLGAYPTLVGALVILWCLLGFSAWRNQKAFAKACFTANLVTGLLLVLFVGSLVWRSSLKDLLFIYDFSTAHASLGSFTGKITYGAWLMMAFLPAWPWLLGGFALWLVLWRKYDLSWYAFALPLSAVVAWREPPEAGTFHPPLLMALVLFSVPLAWSECSKKFNKQWPELVLWLTGVLAAVLTCWSSAMTIYVTFVTATYSLGVAMIWVARSLKNKNLKLLSFALPLLIFAHKVVWLQWDDPHVSTSQKMFTEGPMAGLWTSTERYDFLSQVQSDVREIEASGAKSILFYDEFPLGFLMSDLYPATRSLWVHTLRESYRVRGFFQQYYSDPSTRPDVIFRFNYYIEDGHKVSVQPEQFLPALDVFWRYLPEETHSYQLYKTRDAYSVFMRTVNR